MTLFKNGSDIMFGHVIQSYWGLVTLSRYLSSNFDHKKGLSKRSISVSSISIINASDSTRFRTLLYLSSMPQSIKNSMHDAFLTVVICRTLSTDIGTSCPCVVFKADNFDLDESALISEGGSLILGKITSGTDNEMDHHANFDVSNGNCNL